MKGLTAGTAIVDITPREGLELGGYPHFSRHNTGAHDPLYAGCLYLNHGTTEVVIVTLDILFFSKKHVSSVRERVRKLTGIPVPNIMISCSHTHSGPWASGRLDIESLLAGVEQDAEYVDGLIGKIVGIIIEAKAKAFEAEIGFGREYCGKEQGIGGNRRNPEGPCDPYSYVVAVRDLSGTVRSVLVNYALHPTVLHEDSTLVSADYPSYIRKAIGEKFPSAVMLFAQGTSGDQSTRYFRQGQSFDEAERVGRTIGSAAIAAVGGLKFVRDIGIKVVSEEISIGVRSLPARQVMEGRVREAEADYRHKLEGNASYLEVQNANLKLLGAEDLLGYVIMLQEGGKIELLEAEKPAEVQAISIGELKLIGLPGEVFMEFGLDIKSRVDAGLVIINELANGCLPGYVYTKKAQEEGGYETDTSLLDAQFGYGLVDKAVELAKR